MLREARTIAVVGLSPNPARPSHRVAQYLRDAGYRIIPVNPLQETILEEQSYPTLTAAAAAHQIDIVDVFRRSDLAGAVVDEAVPLKPKAVWLQLGIEAPEACARAEAAGVPCVTGRCLMVTHQRLRP